MLPQTLETTPDIIGADRLAPASEAVARHDGKPIWNTFEKFLNRHDGGPELVLAISPVHADRRIVLAMERLYLAAFRRKVNLKLGSGGCYGAHEPKCHQTRVRHISASTPPPTSAAAKIDAYAAFHPHCWATKPKPMPERIVEA